MKEFTNETLDTGSLPKYEEVPLNSLSKKYWNVMLINIFIFLLIVGIGVTTVLIFNADVRAYLYIILGIYVVFALLMITLYRASLKKRGFAVREKDIMYTSGIIALSTTVVPFSRIQHIALDEGLFSRIYGLGELRIFTAGGSSGSLHIPGIQIEKAKSIKELLMKQINEAD
ncbi:PH domain-containing protein [Pedobacter sp. B4-66]|uniref:PH domain-containing protein n=1 Tax=Pedobacter sp. B4-66 TaxID=2817280 RepID=UPI001BD9135C|nr:PH domain-containing protein [Pedobacter sp. B4-66]